MAALPRVTIFFLVFSTLTHIVFSGKFFRDPSKWPKPPCKMYYPRDPLEDVTDICPDLPAYVCATNGHTYKNECFFCVAKWEFGDIKFVKYGKCGE